MLEPFRSRSLSIYWKIIGQFAQIYIKLLDIQQIFYLSQLHFCWRYKHVDSLDPWTSGYRKPSQFCLQGQHAWALWLCQGHPTSLVWRDGIPPLLEKHGEFSWVIGKKFKETTQTHLSNWVIPLSRDGGSSPPGWHETCLGSPIPKNFHLPLLLGRGITQLFSVDSGPRYWPLSI